MALNTSFKILVICILVQIASATIFNDVCGPLNHCNVTAGLICSSGRCACSSGPFNEQHSYRLEWNAAKNLCVGTPGSVCVGTRATAVAEGMKQIECADDLSCIQIQGAPLGLGLCKAVPKIYYHGVSCSQTKYCDSSRGLVCTNGTCACSEQRSNTSPSYDMTWEEERGYCVGAIGGGCIGTKDSPVRAGHKAVECIVGAECIQTNGQTPGVGTCQRLAGSGAGGRSNSQVIIAIGFLMTSALIKSMFR